MSVDEELFVMQQLSLMLRVGISLPKAFGLIAARGRPAHRAVFEDIRDCVTVGNTMERCFRRHPRVFPPTLIGLVRIGELRGDLPPVLDKYVAILRSDERIKRKLRGALTYPLIVVCAMILLGFGASIFIFPEIERLFVGFELELPAVTRAVIAVSRFAGANGVAILLALIAAAGLFAAWYRRSHAFRVAAHRLVLRLPAFGRIVRERQMSSVMRNLAMLLRAGMPIVEVLEACRAATGHLGYRSSLEEAKEDLRKGNRLSLTLARYPELYPEVAVELIGVGEETGTLADVCSDLAEFYEERVFAFLDALPAVLEPALIFLIGAGVATIAVSILLPMYRFSASI